MKRHQPISPLLVGILTFVALLCVQPLSALAGFTETLPEGTFMLEFSYNHSWLDDRYDNKGSAASLIEEIERYEPGGGMQGVLTPNASVQYQVLINQLQYGILDNLSVGIGIPVVLGTSITPKLSWKEGDYQPSLGRPYSSSDFWEWAESMGQPKPGYWRGNEGVISDIILGVRFRWTDYIDWCKENGLHSALMISGAIPTGKQADSEEIVSAGTTMWDLHSQGELNFHLGVDKTFKEELDGYLTLGLDFFYEVFFEHTYDSPSGKKHPLLLNYEPYIGKTYTIDPGDFMGFAFQTDVIAWKGPVLETWITPKDEETKAKLPAIIAFNLRYTFIGMQQSQWSSNSDLWDYDREDDWKPGYKNLLTGTVMFSLLRVGAPVQLYASYRTLSLIPGKNTRSADVLAGGLRLLMKFW